MTPRLVLSKNSRPDRRSGQAMLIAILSMGGALLGATTVAGFLLLYQIRATTDTQNSAKAIFAADGGVEWALYTTFVGGVASPTFSNGAVDSVQCLPSGDACGNPSSTSAISTGIAAGNDRAFFIDFQGATTTYP